MNTRNIHDDAAARNSTRTLEVARPPVARRDAPVVCPSCGRAVKRKSRQQAYCSRRCRQRAYWERCATAKIAAFVTHDTGRSPQGLKSGSGIKYLQGRKSGPSILAEPPVELLGHCSWRWPGAPRLDPAKRRAIVEAEIGGRSAAPIPATGGPPANI
jgi:hypothetical protein